MGEVIAYGMNDGDVVLWCWMALRRGVRRWEVACGMGEAFWNVLHTSFSASGGSTVLRFLPAEPGGPPPTESSDMMVAHGARAREHRYSYTRYGEKTRHSKHWRRANMTIIFLAASSKGGF